MPLVLSALLMVFSSNALSQEAADSFEKLKPLMFQIKTAASAESEKSSYGTGWIVDKSGLIITNFHVVSDAVWYPKKYKLFMVEDGRAIEVAIESVDVIHDLALIKVPNRTFDNAISLSSASPRNGEEIYNLGLPEDLDWTVVRGVYNGILKQGPYELIHLTSPINSGMSGGPTINKRNELIGVNVSVLTSGQEVSFAIPVRFVRDLLLQSLIQKKKLSHIEQIKQQLTESQDQLSKDFLKALDKSKDLQSWKVPRLASYLKCWGQGSDKSSLSHILEKESCSVEYRTHLDDRVSTTFIQAEYVVIENRSHTELQFNNLINSFWRTRNRELRTYFSKDSIINYAPLKCAADLIQLKDRKINGQVCARAMIPFTELAEYHIKLSQSIGHKHYVQSYVILDGFTAANMKLILEKLISKFPEASNVKN
jgi:serine protease Do